MSFKPHISAVFTGAIGSVTLPHVAVAIVRVEGGFLTFPFYINLGDRLITITEALNANMPISGSPFSTFEQAQVDALQDLEKLTNLHVSLWGPTLTAEAYDSAVLLARQPEIPEVPPGILDPFISPLNLAEFH